MAKTIKFNLILDGYPVRTIESLQEHFSIEDTLRYFRNGLLARWLDVRGYTEKLEAVKRIDPDANARTIVSELARIFEIKANSSSIEESIAILNYLDEEKASDAVYRENAFEKRQIIGDYHSGYNELIRNMEDHQEDMALLKADAIELERTYLDLFMLDYGNLFYRLAANAPRAVFAILTREALRKYWLVYDSDLDRRNRYGLYVNFGIYDSIKKNLLLANKVKSILGDDLKILKRNTQAMWDPIERPEVKIMVISMRSGSFIKNAGEFSEKLGASDVNEKFLFLNGLEYQCNDESYELRYMEV